MRLEAVVAGEEFAKVAGRARRRGRADDDEPIELTVVEEGDEVEDGRGGRTRRRPEVLPADASEAVRLLAAWRVKLAGLSGQTFGHYKLGEVLGRGRCGVVFRAEDAKTGQAVALKVFSPQFPQGNEELQRFAARHEGPAAAAPPQPGRPARRGQDRHLHLGGARVRRGRERWPR